MTEPKRFTKADLKTGMVVENREGKRARVLLGTANGDIISGETWCPLESFLDNLMYKDARAILHTIDIVKVYQPKSNMDYKDFDCNGTLIWQEPPQKTQEEIEYEKLMSQIEQLQQQAQKLKPNGK